MGIGKYNKVGPKQDVCLAACADQVIELIYPKSTIKIFILLHLQYVTQRDILLYNFIKIQNTKYSI